MNQLYNSIKICFTLLLFTTVACTHQMVIQDMPQPEPEFYETTELVLGADSVFQCWMSYEYDDGDCMVFYVHLVNYSVLSAQFDPAACYLEYKYRGNRPDIPGNAGLRVYALNPEAELQYLAAEKEEAEDRNSRDLGFNIVSAVFDLASNIFDGETSNDAEIVEDVFYYGGNIYENVEAGKQQSDFYKDAESFWKEDVLRKKIIQSGEEIGGLVYFPIQRRARKFSAIAPFGGTNNEFEFNLRKSAESY